MKKIFNYSNLFKPGQLVENDPEAAISKVVVPKIQRAYAQGRKQESYVRNNFLNDIFEALRTGTEIDLNFVYGSVKKHDSRYVFELIDGQQRLTTLYLLYWYIGNRELAKDSEEYLALREDLRKFIYETRPTASDFCQFLSDFDGYPGNVDAAGFPSISIRNSKWYFRAFDKDSTIDGMLRMLDAIHSKYEAIISEDASITLFHNMDKIVFYVLSLGEFGLTEELYIKMNARGLPLSAFDNFKAELIGFLKGTEIGQRQVELTDSLNEDTVPYYMDFSTKIDTKWINLFWSKDNKNFDADYFRFFYRFIGNKYLVNKTDISVADMRFDKTQKFFITDSENQDKYLGFEAYKDILMENPEYFLSIEKVLDTFCQHYDKDILPCLKTPWDSGEKQLTSFFEKQLKQMPKIIFCAVTEFIEAYEKFDPVLFKHWMRIAWNIVENTNIDNISKVTQTNRNISKMIRHAASGSKMGIPFFEAIASFNEDENDSDTDAKDRSRTIHEEKVKAARIAEDPEWEIIFSMAESHPFFKGSIMFIYSDGMDKPQFLHRYELAKEMFDAKGVCGPYKEDGHILLRALLSKVKDWKELWKKSLTDKVESQKHFKNLLSSNANIQEYLCSILDESSSDAILNRCKIDVQPHSELLINGEPAAKVYRKVHESLYRKPRLQNWLQNNDAITLRDFKGNIFMLKRNSSWAKVMLDTYREKFIPEIVENFGYYYYDDDQRQAWDQMGYYYGNDVTVYKRVSNTEVRIRFDNYSSYVVTVKPSLSIRNDFIEKFLTDKEVFPDENGFIKICSGEYNGESFYTEFETYVLNKIEDILDS